MNAPLATQLCSLRIRTGHESLSAFARLYLPHRFPLPWSRMHKEICNDLHAVGDRSPVRLVLSAPDGYGKSSLVSFAFVIWALAYQRAKCIVIGSSSRNAAGELLGGIDTELRQNRLLQRDFPHLRTIARSSGASGSRASPPRLIAVPSVAKVHTIGPTSHLTEVSFEGTRPDLFILDEFDPGFDTLRPTDEQPRRSDRLEQTLKRRIIDRFTEASIIVAGPLLDTQGLIDRLLAPEVGSFWMQRFYPAVERYPGRFEQWFEWAACWKRNRDHGEDYLKHHREQLLEGASVLWPEHESFEKLMRLRAERGWAWFDAYRQGLPPGGCLRAGFNRAQTYSVDEGSIITTLVDDAGYRRLPPAGYTQPEAKVRLITEDSEKLGKALPISPNTGEIQPF